MISSSVFNQKALIISEGPFCLDNGFGVTLTTFFQGWPRDNLVQFYTKPVATPTYEVCSQIVYAGIHYARRYAIPFFFGNRSAAWRNHYSKGWLRKALGAWRPDVIYVILYSYETLAYSSWVAQQLDCPLILHVADDQNPPPEVDREKIRNLYAAANLRLAISETMKAAYETLYQLPFQVLHNGAADDLFTSDAQTSSPETDLVLRYLGALYSHMHLEAIEDIIDAVKELNHRGIPARFEIYGGENTQTVAMQLADGNTVFYKGPVSQTEGYELLKTADVLVIPISFNEKGLTSLRLSMPTKLAEYLASGTPTLVYGHPSTASVDFCLKHGLGLIQTERSVPALVDKLTQVTQDREKFRIQAQQDRAFAQKHLSASAIRNRFYELLAETT